MARRELPLPSQKHIALAMADVCCPHVPGWKARTAEDRRFILRAARRTLRNLERLGFSVVPTPKRKRGR